MNTHAKVIAAAGAVLLVAVVGCQSVPGNGGGQVGDRFIAEPDAAPGRLAGTLAIAGRVELRRRRPIGERPVPAVVRGGG